MKQEELIAKTDWDLLIILDACRYDYFKPVYADYLGGKLMKAISPASNTYEWCKKVLEQGDFSDVVFVSANPYINSKMKVLDFDPRNGFKEIIDVWEFGWDEEIQTVRPEVMTVAVNETMQNFPNARVIAHYIQPHFPAISLHIHHKTPPENSGPQNLKPFTSLGVPVHLNKLPRGRRIRKRLGDLVERLPVPLLREYWRFQLARGKVTGPDIVTFAKVGIKQMREAYEQNLRMALKSLSRLVGGDRKVVITADHGELLGDTGFMGKKLGHPSHLRYKQLVEVPWFEVSTVKRESDSATCNSMGVTLTESRVEMPLDPEPKIYAKCLVKEPSDHFSSSFSSILFSLSSWRLAHLAIAL